MQRVYFIGRLEVDDESPSRNYILLTLLAQEGAVICRVQGIIVTQFCPQRDRKEKAKRCPVVEPGMCSDPIRKPA